MQAEETKVLWEKHNDHDEKINRLIKDQAVHAHQMKSIDDKITRYMEECAKGHTELKTSLDGYTKNVQSVLENHHKRAGVHEALRWAVPVIISLAMLIVALFQIKGGV